MMRPISLAPLTVAALLTSAAATACSSERAADAPNTPTPSASSPTAVETPPVTPVASPASAPDDAPAPEVPEQAPQAEPSAAANGPTPAELEQAVKQAEELPACAELRKRSRCSIEKLEDELARTEVERALDEAMASWGDFAANPAVRDQAATACAQALIEGAELWSSQGC